MTPEERREVTESTRELARKVTEEAIRESLLDLNEVLFPSHQWVMGVRIDTRPLRGIVVAIEIGDLAGGD
jgi:hypothetical protein